jgi:hypothetical protein
MNANQIHMGVDYAFTEYPSRGVTYYPYATRVRVNFVYKVNSPYSTKKRTLVEFVLLEEDGSRKVNPRTGNDWPIQTAPARQIVATWDEHLVERDRHMEKQRARQDRHEQQLREQEERIERERAQRALRDQKVYEALASIGIPKDIVTLNSYEVRIARYGLEAMLEQNTNETASEEPAEIPRETQRSEV